MGYITVEQKKSLIGAPKKVACIVRSMGLGRIGKVREYRDSRAIRGQINKVCHLVSYRLHQDSQKNN
ncbi:MAG: 50S ribosomal protein L30 [Proteobacteria bacterium]|nr:50S ribosomal protein L30 [Pseudomonadota bacterium]